MLGTPHPIPGPSSFPVGHRGRVMDTKTATAPQRLGIQST